MAGIEDGLMRLARLGFRPTGILDVGAYEGWFARVARSIFPDAFIFMVEAVEERAPSLERTAADVGEAGYAIRALGSSEGQIATFYLARGGTPDAPCETGSSLYPEKTGVPLEARTLRLSTLDGVAPSERPFQLIKMDVQGAELDVLRGATATLAPAEFILLEISILQYNVGSPLIAEVIGFMRALGYVVFDILDMARLSDGRLNQIDCLFARKGHPLIHVFPH
jgi:FkbM family methyltransferase